MERVSHRSRNAISAIAVCLALAVWIFVTRDRGPVFLEPGAAAVRTAEAAAAAFHDGFNKRRYEDVCRTADPDAFRAITGLRCAEFLDYMRTRLGEVRAASRSQLPVSDGDVRVAVTYQTRFAKETATERFEWRIADGRATLISYSVDAPSLGR